jgi:hypothetical protein
MTEAVECLASASYPGDPIAVTWQGQRHEVEAILDRWRGPQELGFRVRTRELDGLGAVFELIYDGSADDWRITPWIQGVTPR